MTEARTEGAENTISFEVELDDGNDLERVRELLSETYPSAGWCSRQWRDDLERRRRLSADERGVWKRPSEQTAGTAGGVRAETRRERYRSVPVPDVIVSH